jgi:hypothetical protein
MADFHYRFIAKRNEKRAIEWEFLMITILHTINKAELFCINNSTHFCGTGSRLVLVHWIRIQEDKLTHKKEEIACFEVLV